MSQSQLRATESKSKLRPTASEFKPKPKLSANAPAFTPGQSFTTPQTAYPFQSYNHMYGYPAPGVGAPMFVPQTGHLESVIPKASPIHTTPTPTPISTPTSGDASQPSADTATALGEAGDKKSIFGAPPIDKRSPMMVTTSHRSTVAPGDGTAAMPEQGAVEADEKESANVSSDKPVPSVTEEGKSEKAEKLVAQKIEAKIEEKIEAKIEEKVETKEKKADEKEKEKKVEEKGEPEKETEVKSAPVVETPVTAAQSDANGADTPKKSKDKRVYTYEEMNKIRGEISSTRLPVFENPNSEIVRTAMRQGMGSALQNLPPQRPEELLSKKRGEDAWRPTKPTDEDELKLKFVRGVLNKLTPEKFQVLSLSIVEQKLDSKAVLEGVIDLIFDKAVMERNFAGIYADLVVCVAYPHRLKSKMGDTSGEQSRDEEVAANSFRRMLLNKCQHEFVGEEKKDEGEEKKEGEEKNAETEAESEEAAAKKAEEEAEKQRLAKIRMIGNVRFIGELFKRSMLQRNVMYYCTNFLLESGRDEEARVNEEDIEALCQLLTTIGQALDVDPDKARVDAVMKELEQITQRTGPHAPSKRITFMIQDLIELRNERKWVPKRGTANPKTIKEVHAEANREQAAKEARRAGKGRERGDRSDRSDRGDVRRGGSFRDTAQDVRGEGGGRQTHEWEQGGKKKGGFKDTKVAGRKPRRAPTSLNGTDANSSTDRLRTPNKPKQSPIKNEIKVHNTFANLLNESGSESEQDSDEKEEVAGDMPSASTSPAPSRESSRPSSPVRETEDPERLQRQMKGIATEFVLLKDSKEAVMSFGDRVTPNMYPEFVTTVINFSIDQNKHAEDMLQLLVTLKKFLKSTDICKGLDTVLEVLPDILVDSPNASNLLVTILSGLIAEEMLDLSYLTKALKPTVESGVAQKMLGGILVSLKSRMESHTLIAQLMEADLEVKNFLKGNKKKADVKAFLKEYDLEDIIYL